MSISPESSEFQQPERADHPTVATFEALDEQNRTPLYSVPQAVTVDGQVRLKDVVYAEPGAYTDLNRIAFGGPRDLDETYEKPFRAYSNATSTQELTRTIPEGYSERNLRISAAKSIIARLYDDL
jgi:hypothetical protein